MLSKQSDLWLGSGLDAVPFFALVLVSLFVDFKVQMKSFFFLVISIATSKIAFDEITDLRQAC